MTPVEQFLMGLDRAMEPGGAAAPKPVAQSQPEGHEISEVSRKLFTGGLQRIALAQIPLLPVPTTARSPWYRRRCAECRHTFRVDDPAATCPRCSRVYHWNPIHGLDCLGVVFDNEEGRCICREVKVPDLPLLPADRVAPEQMAAFVSGLAHEWSAYSGQIPVSVTPELEGRLCAVCGHTVRLREMVVRCPCGNGPDGVCPALIHLDFARRLHCWNDWNGGRGRSYCPLTGHGFRSREGSQ